MMLNWDEENDVKQMVVEMYQEVFISLGFGELRKLMRGKKCKHAIADFGEEIHYKKISPE